MPSPVFDLAAKNDGDVLDGRTDGRTDGQTNVSAPHGPTTAVVCADRCMHGFMCFSRDCALVFAKYFCFKDAS